MRMECSTCSPDVTPRQEADHVSDRTFDDDPHAIGEKDTQPAPRCNRHVASLPRPIEVPALGEHRKHLNRVA
jgi:hypothetical protein